jgi:hypothetical protein
LIARLAFLSARLAIFSVVASFLARLAALTALGAPNAGASIDADSSAAVVSSARNTTRLREPIFTPCRLRDAIRIVAPEARALDGRSKG